MKFIPFDSRDIFYKSPFGAVVENETVTLRLLLHNDAHCSGAFVKIREDAGREQFVMLTAGETFEADYCWYSAELTLPEGLYWYSFCFDSPWGRQFVTRFKNGEGHVSRDGGEWQLTVFESDYKTPDKFSGGIIYQIFPDRFYYSGT